MSSSHHHRHGDSAKQKRARRILAFFLSLIVSFLSLALCVRISFVSKTAIVNTMTSYVYVQGVHKNALDYAHDLCDECSLPYDSVDKVLTFDTMYELQREYYIGILKASDEFSETAYKEYIESIGERLNDATLEMLENKNIKCEGSREEMTALFSQKIKDYITEITELAFTSVIKTVATAGGIASLAAAGAALLAGIVLALIIVSIGKKLYRAIRDIACSFYAAAIINLMLMLGVQIVKHFKTLSLYPRYLSNAIMSYVNNCVSSVGISAAALIIIGLVLTGIVWRMNRNENN